MAGQCCRSEEQQKSHCCCLGQFLGYGGVRHPCECWQREAAAARRVQAAREVSLSGEESGILGKMKLLQGFAK